MTQDLLEKIQTLIENDVLEPIIDDNGIRLVYLMNDAVESFIVLHNARITGEYEPQNEEPLTGSVQLHGKDYILSIRQGTTNAFTITFSSLSLEENYYNYGEIGHFWIPAHPLLRRIEFICAILRDKREYLGPYSLTVEENILADLYYFPPLLRFPSVPEKYRVIHETSFEKIQASIRAMRTFVTREDSFSRLLKRYEQTPTSRLEKKLARLLAKKKYSYLIESLLNHIKKAGNAYSSRDFGEHEKVFQGIKKAALAQKEEFERQGKKVHIFYEEPFSLASDDIKFQAFLIVEGDKNIYRFYEE